MLLKQKAGRIPNQEHSKLARPKPKSFYFCAEKKQNKQTSKKTVRLPHLLSRVYCILLPGDGKTVTKPNLKTPAASNFSLRLSTHTKTTTMHHHKKRHSTKTAFFFFFFVVA
jgi:hypothetical protein